MKKNPSQTITFLIAILVLMVTGCSVYRFGPQSMFRSDIRTIYLPIARNETFRDDLGVRLTEAIMRRIQERTPYRVVGDPGADSTLACRFSADHKRVLTETNTDEVRAFDVIVSVEASWVDRRGAVLMENRLLPAGNQALFFIQDARVVPEAGQALQSELQEAIEDLADRIVGQMELRW